MEFIATAEDIDDDPLPGGLIVAHFRVDPGRRVITALGWGSLAIIAGFFVVASGLFVSRAMSSVDAPRPMFVSRYSGGAVDENGVPLEQGDELLVRLIFGAVGLGFILSGGGIVLVGMRRELSHETYLMLRTDGVLFRDGVDVAGVRWEDVEEVFWDETEGALCFEAHDGEVWARRERFAGVEGHELARRAADVRRKALFGLYPR